MKRFIFSSLVAAVALSAAGASAQSITLGAGSNDRRGGGGLSVGVGINIGNLIGKRQNGTGQPDLVVVPWKNGSNGQPNTGFCGPWNGGNQTVKFYIRNAGSGAAGPSMAYVGFQTNTYLINVPALNPGQQALVTRAIPAQAWGPSQYHSSVAFQIAADHLDQTTESPVTNNYGNGHCVGPAT